jgi:hypothetical protein
MSLQFSTTLRNGQADQITSVVGSNALLSIFTGTPPVNCAAASTGTQLAQLSCSATFAPSSSGGVLTVSTITAANAIASGLAGYFRLFKSDGITCVMQGTVTQTGGGGDLVADNPTFSSGSPVSFTSWTITALGA